MITPKTAIVVPTCRSVNVVPQSIPVAWYIVHDEELRGCEIDPSAQTTVKHVVAPEPAFYGRRSSSIRSAGVLEAYHDGAEFILTVDDDCVLPYKWAEEHVIALKGATPIWTNTAPDEWGPMRGMPAPTSIPVGITHGLWRGMPDFYAEDQLRQPEGKLWPLADQPFKPIHAPFPMSSMNLGWRREVTSAMYFVPQGPDTPFNRFEDIWCGVLAQRVLTGKYAFLNGGAIVTHTRASNALKNLEVESFGREIHEHFWKAIWREDLGPIGSTVRGRYIRAAGVVAEFARNGGGPYFEMLSKNMRKWAEWTR